MVITLWIVRIVLALTFLMAGFMKSFMPLERLKKNMTWVASTPAALVRFIGIAELLGAIGLILPVLTGIVPWLTIAAAIGLAIAMLCAAIFHATRKEYSGIAPSAVLLLLTLFVLVGHLVWVPLA